MNILHSILFFFLLFAANGVNAQFFEKEHTIIDVKNSITWLRCSVGQTWNSNDQTCIGSIVKLNHEEIEIATKQAAEQLGGKWRLPSLEELESLVCKECGPPKIQEKFFPNITPEAYWSGKKNFLNSKMHWTVNFMTGHSYSRFFSYQKLPVLLVQDR